MELARWLAEDRSATDARELIEAFGPRLGRAGIPVWRISSSTSSIHPEVAYHNVRWADGEPAVVGLRPIDTQATTFFTNSPLAHVGRTGEPELRIRLDGDPAALEFAICRELAGQGATDYLLHILSFTRGRTGYISYAARAPGGFTDEAIGQLRALVPALSLRLELCCVEFTMSSLLQVYLGASAAKRVLGGAVGRGIGAPTEAAVWFCDMRGFTELSDRRPAAEVVATLDRYFEAVAAPLHAHGGEILKFIGDAVLAIFPVRDGDRAQACRRALAAATEALAAAPVPIGVALHLGEVLFGNIGARDRLDFTVIGPAVNEVCRVEALCKGLGRPLLVTAPFARAAGDARCASVGAHALRGVAAPQEIFAVDLDPP